MNSNPPKKSPVTAINDPQDLQPEDQIRLRAYQLYEARGREDGHEVEDWLRAEEELTQTAEVKLPEKKNPLIAA